MCFVICENKKISISQWLPCLLAIWVFVKMNTDVRPSVFVPDAKVLLNVLLTYDTDLFTYVSLHFLRVLFVSVSSVNFFPCCVPPKMTPLYFAIASFFSEEPKLIKQREML